ncbi:MAG: SOS response-associated peptidase [Proteobacteria bacterium]|nr:SOS response-associated peptidase [Pseudomonadota bacterium]
MCGRFVRTSSIPVITKRFNVEKLFLPEIPPSYNIAPNQEVVIINNNGVAKQLLPCRWGFLPSWAKDMSMGMINARAETVAEKPFFRYALNKHRCLIAADGFYEWGNKNSKRYPVYIKLKSGEPFGFAGLYNFWESPDGSMIPTCTIITAEPNELINPIHQRMPVIIPKDDEDQWLDPALEDKGILLQLLKPYPSGAMELYPVSPKMNSPLYNHPENIQPIEVQ